MYASGGTVVSNRVTAMILQDNVFRWDILSSQTISRLEFATPGLSYSDVPGLFFSGLKKNFQPARAVVEKRFLDRL